MQLESLQFRYMPLVDTRELPKPLTNLFLDVYLELTYEELLDKCEDVVSNVSLTYLQKYTCQQCLSKIWCLFCNKGNKQCMDANMKKMPKRCM